jgi:hypothetical protein
MTAFETSVRDIAKASGFSNRAPFKQPDEVGAVGALRMGSEGAFTDKVIG